MASIEQIADKIAAMKAAHRDDIVKVIAGEFAPGYTPAPTPQPEPEAYTAEQAWEKMEQGYRIDAPWSVGRRCWYLGGDGKVWFEFPVRDRHSTTPSLDTWNQGNAFTLHGIHPKAHEYAMQRHLAAGLAVGSRVEVVHHEQGEGVRYWQSSTPVSGQHTVVEIRSGSPNLRLDNGKYVPAHCLRLLPAESAEPDNVDVDDVMLEDIAPQPAFKPGDVVWVKGRTTIPVDSDGEVEVRFGDESWQACSIPASALRPAPPAAEGVGE